MQVTKLHLVVVQQSANGYGATVDINIKEGYPVTSNHVDQTEFAAEVAREIAGDDRVNTDQSPVMGGEDFSYMLESRPGAFIFMGNGDTAGLHHEEYDFNDDAIPVGSSYWAKIIERSMPAVNVSGSIHNSKDRFREIKTLYPGRCVFGRSDERQRPRSHR